jgi:hypothetical protein
MNYKDLVKKVCESGDLVILGCKGTAKTTLLMHLARELRKNPKNHVIIMETFPKWIHDFDSIPYMVIKDSDVVQTENYPYMQQDYSYIQWSKDYTIVNANEVVKALKLKDVIFLIECEDMEKISAFMTFVIYQIYRKQYLRAKANNLETTNENYWFLIEEAHNLLDSTVIAKKTFNKLRKIQNEFRNLKMHLICVALRLQDLNPRIRSKMSIMMSKISLDDYQLKIRQLLRNSNFKNEITKLEKGKFLFPETDAILETTPFKQHGKPQEIRFQQQPEPKKSLIDKIAEKIFGKPKENPKEPKEINIKTVRLDNEEEEDSDVETMLEEEEEFPIDDVLGDDEP